MTEQQVKNLIGLSLQEVQEKLKLNGFNELPSAKKRNIFKIMLDVFKEPMFILLVACGVTYLALGNLKEAIMLLGFVIMIMGITIYQESKTEKALQSLKDLTSPRALVIRNGQQTRIAGREVVMDDLVIIKEGDRIPADSILIWGINIKVDESLLTGESSSVIKIPADDASIKILRPGGDNLHFLYSGTLVVQGQGVAKVSATGINTEIGKIGRALKNIEEEDTILQTETGRIVKFTFMIAVFLSILMIIFYGVSYRDWLKGILSGITLAMAMLPEEFPVVLTVFLALGAWRISKKKVLTRKIESVEILGSSTVLCVDKTGTLTQNKMSIKMIYSKDEFYDVLSYKDRPLPENFHELIEYGILASKKDPFDPMEKALKDLGITKLNNTEHLHDNWPLVEEYPLSKNLLALSHVWEIQNKMGYVISAKGAPEAICDLCHLSVKDYDDIYKKVNIMAGQGLRVLGIAKSFLNNKNLPKTQHDFDFEFIGLIGLTDPIRESVPAAIKECYRAGIKVIMITGDYPSTAQNIAGQIGLRNSGEVFTGHDLELMSEIDLEKKIKDITIFARVVPEQKLLIVNALKATGEIVAMTGDGVNDAPALKSAHIGVAMGERGTDVARESSGIVLVNDDFSSIVSAVRMGRRIFDNLKKALVYIISVHVPIAGLSLIPVILRWPIILYPVHVVFLELIIDPACSVVFESEAEEPDIMDRAPRNTKEPLFSNRLLAISFLQGLFSLLTVLLIFKVSLRLGMTEEDARSITFFTLIISNLFLILTNRSWNKSMFSMFLVPNKALYIVIFAALSFLFLVTLVPFLQNIFHFTAMHFIDIIIALTSGLLSIIWFELVKFIYNRFNKKLLKN